MLDTDLRLMDSRKVATIQTWKPSFEPFMTVPVFALNRLAHSFSRHRKGMVLCLAPVCTFTEPQCGQAMPCGQRRAMNRAYPVVTHTHYMYGVASSGPGGGQSGDGCLAA